MDEDEKFSANPKDVSKQPSLKQNCPQNYKYLTAGITRLR